MKKKVFFVAAALLAMVATSCKKENIAQQQEIKSTHVTLNASYAGGSKVSYTQNGNAIDATWEVGDKILVCYDGLTSELAIQSGQGTTSATFSGAVSHTTGHEPKATTMLVCYVKDANLSSTPEITFDGTGTYVYTDDAFKNQDGTLSGAGKLNLYYGAAFYGTGSNISCEFKPNTSIMKFTLTGVSGDANSEATLSYKSGSTEIAKATFNVTADINVVYLSIPAGQYSGVQKLVYTCGQKVWEYQLSATAANFTAGHTYSKDITLAPAGAVNGVFTVSNDNGTTKRQIFFSKGNLQYNKTTQEWSFMEHQYTTVETLNQNVGNNYADQSIVSLFGWGTWTGSSPNPTRTDYVNPSSYTWDSSDFQGTITNASGTWYTLNKNEWQYLFNSKRSQYAFLKAEITAGGSTHKGVILFPDGYDGSIGSYSYNDKSGYTSVIESHWTSMEAIGCVFLPAAGYRSGTDVDFVGDRGYYWSSTSNVNLVAYAFRVYFYVANLFAGNNDPRNFGQSVRLVQDK